MDLVLFSNHLNHHQVALAEEIYKYTNGSFRFVEISPMTVGAMKGGSDFSNRPYLIQAWKDKKMYSEARSLAKDADVAIFGAESLEYEVLRMRTSKKLAFEMSERWLKRGWINFFSPRLIKYQWYYHTLFYNKPLYKLCSSAFGANDQYKMFSFYNRCFKWGYFTNVDSSIDCNFLKQKTLTGDGKFHLMWCARFLAWKHPELPILLAERLKQKGYCFQLDMYGGGPILEKIKHLAYQRKVNDIVNFHGNEPNDRVLKAMREHDIFLFTSDQNEGWGAVANESMSNGCVLVGSNTIGSIPYLIKHRENGCIFDAQNINSLEAEIIWLFNHPSEIYKIQCNAIKQMQMIWNPRNAVQSLFTLIDNLQHGHTTSIKEGPCSEA